MITQPTRIIELPITSIIVNRRFRRCMGDIDALMASIKEIGLLQPIVVLTDKTLVAGQRRLEACRRLEQKRIMCSVVSNFVDAWANLLAEVQENTCRERFLPSEAAAAAQDLQPLAYAAAKRRQGRCPDSDRESSSENFSELGRSMDHIARLVGLSRPTLLKAIKIVEAAREEPEKYSDLVELMDRTGKVNGAYMQLVSRQGKSRNHRRPSFSVRVDKNGRLKFTGVTDATTILIFLKREIHELEKELSKQP